MAMVSKTTEIYAVTLEASADSGKTIPTAVSRSYGNTIFADRSVVLTFGKKQ